MFKIARSINEVDRYIAKQHAAKEIGFNKITRTIPLNTIQRMYSNTDGCYITSHFLTVFIKRLSLNQLIQAIIEKKDIYADYQFNHVSLFCHECGGIGYKDWVRTTKSDTNKIKTFTIGETKTPFAETYALSYNSSLSYGCNVTAIRKHEKDVDNVCTNCFGCGIEPDKMFGRLKENNLTLPVLYDKYIKGQREW